MVDRSDGSAPLVPAPALAPVPAYPRAAVESYLADAGTAAVQLRGELAVAEARRARALEALDAAAESHRVIGRLVVEAQQELAARHRHAERAVEELLVGADEEARAILARARTEVAVILGNPVPVGGPADPIPASLAAPEATASRAGSDPDDAEPWDPSELGSGGPPRAPERPPAAGLEHLPPPPPTRPFHAVPGAAEPVPAGVGAPFWSSWRSRRQDPWTREHEGDDGYFSRLRDELRAEGGMTWFETA